MSEKNKFNYEAVLRKGCTRAGLRKARIKKKEAPNVPYSEKVFTEIITGLQQIEVRRDHLANEIGIDTTTYEDMFFIVIEKLLHYSFNKKQLKLIQSYLYELPYDENWNGTITLKLSNKEERVFNFRTPKDVWKVLQNIK